MRNFFNYKAASDIELEDDLYTLKSNPAFTVQAPNLIDYGFTVWKSNADETELTELATRKTLKAALALCVKLAEEEDSRAVWMAFNHNHTELMEKPSTRSDAEAEARKYTFQTGNAAYVDFDINRNM